MARDAIQAFERLFTLDEACMEKRYQIYHDVLHSQRIFWSDVLQLWVFTHYADVRDAVRDSRLSSEKLPGVMRQLPEAIRTSLDPQHPLLRQANKIMMARDDPDHARLRTIVNKAFTPRMIERQRPQIEQLAQTLLDQLEQQEQPNIIRDFATPLPIMVIAQMIGIPCEDIGLIKRWSDVGTDFLGKVTDFQDSFYRMAATAMEFNTFLRPYLEERRRHPQDDLLSAFILAEAQGETLSEEEIIANIFLLLAAGNETTTNLIGNGTLTLLKHPEQRELLQQRPELIEAAVEEILRYESPSQTTSRRAKVDITIAGQQIKQNDNILLVLGAAHRDPKQFSKPDQFDIARQDNKHIAFGIGPHYCLGAPLARLEAQITLSMLLARYPRMRLAEDRPRWRKVSVFLGLEHLPVVLS